MKLALSILVILLITAPAFSQNTGVIKELSGTVELKQAGEAGFSPAKAGDAVALKTIVSTGFKSLALIELGSAVISVRPLTRLSLEELSVSTGAETINLSLQTGRVRVDVNPPAGTRASMTVQSPIATASVRGTSFDFDTETLTVHEGTVVFSGSSGGIMLVSAGFSSDVSEYGKAADPIENSTTQLMLPPLPGSNSGFRNGKAPDVYGELSFPLVLK